MPPLDPELRKRFFEAAEESPGSWLLSAQRLRAAAARLDWLVVPVRDDENTISFLAVYRMLLGLAFENVLKGVISLVRIEAGENPPLPKDCLHHSLRILAARPECAVLGLTSHEIELLDDMTQFVEWSGKYPLPKKADSYLLAGHSNREHAAELVLWDRMVQILFERCWIMKGGPAHLDGNRLYLKNSLGKV